jgi:hypothetical protein
VSEVSVGRNELFTSVVFPVPCFALNNNIVATSEWVSVVSNWFENDFRLISDSISSAGAIIIPIWEIS